MKTVMLKLVHTETFFVPVVTEDDNLDIEERIRDMEYDDLDEIADAIRDGASLVGPPRFSAVDRGYDIYVKQGADYDSDVNHHVILFTDGTFDYGPIADEEPTDHETL